MYLIQFDGIGTKWSIELPKKVSSLESKILQCVKDFDYNYSRFKDNSFIGVLNSKKIITNFPYELFKMISFAEKLSVITHGYFDIGFGGVLESIGYDMNLSFKSKKNSSEKFQGIKVLEKDTIELFDDTRIDLGSLGKGFLIDKIAEIIESFGINEFTVNGGGDIFVKCDKKQKFFLESPFETGKFIGEIEIQNESIACSSPNRRVWQDKDSGVKHSHLILKDNISKSEKKVAVFTRTQNAFEADALSTAIFVSPSEIVEIISKQFDVEFLIVFDDSSSFQTKNFKANLY